MFGDGLAMVWRGWTLVGGASAAPTFAGKLLFIVNCLYLLISEPGNYVHACRMDACGRGKRRPYVRREVVVYC